MTDDEIKKYIEYKIKIEIIPPLQSQIDNLKENFKKYFLTMSDLQTIVHAIQQEYKYIKEEYQYLLQLRNEMELGRHSIIKINEVIPKEKVNDI